MSEFKTGTWYPIESCPKDGSRFLAYCPCEDYQNGYSIEILEYIPDKDKFCVVACFKDYHEEQPTHWQPLPKSPEV